MRRVMYSVAMSLDGYIARPNGAFDWIPNDPTIDWSAFTQRFDTMLVGRKTFEVSQSAAAGGSMGGMRTYVFSRTLRPADHPGVTIVGDDFARVVTSLRKQPGKDIWLMGGGQLFRSLLEANLVDAVETGVVPVLLGEGLPLLPPLSRTTRLKLTKTHTYRSGVVLLAYDVVRSRAKARA